MGRIRTSSLSPTMNNTKETSDAFVPSPSPTVDILIDKACYWIHNAISIGEQIEVFQEIQERSKDIDNSQKTPCMNPSPKTLIFNGNTPTLCFGNSQSHSDDDGVPLTSASLSSVFERLIVSRAMALVSQQHLQPPQTEASPSHGSDDSTTNIIVAEHMGVDRYTVSVIRYPAPDGSFAEHIDHCNNPKAWVVLLSLGCTATFSVRRSRDDPKTLLKLESGDVMVFDPSTTAAIRHGVVSIEESTCPRALVEAFEDMAEHRFGVQCRTSCLDQWNSAGSDEIA